ncbi:hypothetical protein WJX79_008043 [Trebouxia sp. C0005]|nr:MAG: hypothetical protein FRX49_06805 [Trebouxia sp. A1-2]
MPDVEWHETLFLLQHDSSGGRLPPASEEPEKLSDSQEISAWAACEVQQVADGGLHAGSVPLSHRLPCDNVPVRPKRRVRFDLKDGSESQHDQENLASQ